MEPGQEEFILEELSLHPCHRVRVDPGILDATAANNILDGRLIGGSDATSLLRLLDIYSLLTSPSDQEFQFCDLHSTVQAWLLHLQDLRTTKEVFSLDLRRVEAIIKRPKMGSNVISNREYIVGVACLNRLRRVVPTFAYTLGALRPDDSTKGLSILYEHVPGDSLAKLLQEGMTFKAWLGLFAQILISLELAQREVRFSHFDLHADNVIVRPTHIDEYSVPLDLDKYVIRKPKTVPVIIDFELSTAAIKGQVVGTHDYGTWGVFNFMVPCHDMYRIMVSSYVHAGNPKTKRRILELFQFFGDADPYSIATVGKAGILKADDEYCQGVAFSHAANQTPLQMLTWLEKTHKKHLASFLRISPRREYLSFWGLEGKPHPQEVREITEGTIATRSSYAVPRYFIHLLQTCGDHDPRVSRLQTKLEENKRSLLENDIATLSGATKIPVPDQEVLSEARELVEKTYIRSPPKTKKARTFTLQETLSYEKALQPYLQQYLMILELGLQKDYAGWLKEFHTSEVYLFYCKNVAANSRAERWGETLLTSIMGFH